MDVNQWFLSLPPERQAILREDKWMLANAVARAATELEREGCAKTCEGQPTASAAALAIRARAD